MSLKPSSFKTGNARLRRQASIQSSGLPGKFTVGNENDTSDTSWSIGDIAHSLKWEREQSEVSGSGATQELKINFPEVGWKLFS